MVHSLSALHYSFNSAFHLEAFVGKRWETK